MTALSTGTIPVLPWGKLAFGIDTAAEMIDGSRSHICKLLREGKLKGFKSGKKLLIPAAELQAYLNSLPRAQFTPLPNDRISS